MAGGRGRRRSFEEKRDNLPIEEDAFFFWVWQQ